MGIIHLGWSIIKIVMSNIEKEKNTVKKMEAPLDMKIGAKFKTNRHGYVTVIEYYNCHTVIVVFENTGNIRSISAAKLRSGKLADRSVLPESIMIGEKVESVKHGELTITQVESDNIVVLINSAKEEIRMLLPTVQKMKDKAEKIKESTPTPTSLRQLTKRSKKAKDVNKLLKKMLTDYGK